MLAELPLGGMFRRSKCVPINMYITNVIVTQNIFGDYICIIGESITCLCVASVVTKIMTSVASKILGLVYYTNTVIIYADDWR